MRSASLVACSGTPEVKHSDYGQVALENFLFNVAGLKKTWSTGNIIEEQVAKIREQVGDDQVHLRPVRWR